MKLVATTIISLMAILAVAAPSANPASPKTPPAPGSKDNKNLSPHSKSASAGAPDGSDCYWTDACPKAHPTAMCCPVGAEYKNGKGCNDNPNAGVAGKQ